MSDIQKLHKVIESLEEQSTKASEFNGVLSEVNSARADIANAKEAFSALGDEQQKLVTNTYTKFDEYGAKLAAVEVRLATLERKIVTAEQFESGRDKITSLIAENNGNIQKLLAAQTSSIKFLRMLMILGFLVLSGGIAFLAKDAFM